ncbi:MAG: GNAT family N-acetyltransferase [Bacteroidota bacterium]|nr:GNAT family N-acetyltransferase [Bacteroidota bacterium]
MKTNNIKLRAIEPEDIDFLYQCENDPDVWHVSNTHLPFSKHTLRRYIDHANEDIFLHGQIRFVVAEHNNAPCGMLDFFDFDPFHRRAGIGIIICKEKRNKGYAKEALSLGINYAFEYLNLHLLYCNISESNTVSRHLFESAGFTQCGVKKDWLKTKTDFENELMYQLINPAG